MKKFCVLLALLIATQSNMLAQLTGTKTINPGGGDYTSFAAAINDLNSNGVGVGGVTFNVAAGTSFYEVENYVTTVTTSAANPVIFQKEGSGANPVIYGKVIGGTDYDMILGVIGSDYVTFDGIDLVSDPTAVNDADKIEYGLGIYSSGTDGCDHITFKNSKIIIERRTGTLEQFGMEISQTTTALSGIHSNIKIENVTFLKGSTSLSISANSIPNENIEVKNCKFGESGTIIEPVDNGGVVWIVRCKNFSFHDNEIQNVVAPNFTGLYVMNFFGENHIYNNRIYNLRSTSTIEYSDLMVISANSTDANSIMNIYNNLIYDFDGSKSTSTAASNPYWNLQILMLSGSAKFRVYNNTIVASSDNQHENIILCWGAPLVTEIKNNIFADFSVAGINSYRGIFLSDGIIENNILWIDESLPNNFAYRSLYKFRDWQKWNILPSPGFFLKNMLANPNFNDIDNFDFTLKNPSPASGNGQPLGIVTSSLNGVARNANNPDIGAFEGDFGPPTDLLPPVIRFQPIPHNSLSQVKLNAEITDNTGVTVANIWFRSKGSDAAFTQVAGVKFGTLWEFSFPAISMGEYEYFVCAKDASDNIISNGYCVSGLDVAKTGLAVNNPIANTDFVYSFSYQKTITGGSYTVGTGGDYTSLTKPGGLFEALNSSLISGNVNVTLISDLEETGEIALKQFQESGTGNYSLTIKPNSTSSRTITNNTTVPLSISGADRLTIDGSFGGDNLNHITFTANSTYPIRIINSGTNGCTNITIKNCDFSSVSWACIYATGNNHSDILIENVNSVKGFSGVSFNSVTRPVIRNCTFGNTDMNNSLTSYGIYLSGCLDILIEKNTIRNIINATDNASAYGIYVGSATGGSVSQNKITEVKNNTTVGNGISNGITALSSKNITISNNIISGINGYGSSAYTYQYGIKGVVLASCDNVKFYYNTVNLYGTGNIFPGGGGGKCYTLSTENSLNLDITNNIFSNTIENSVTSYTIGVIQLYNVFSNIYRNNIHFIGGSKAYFPFRIVNEGGYLNFIAWQSNGFAPGNGRDLGSGFGDPLFTGSTANDVSLQSLSPAISSGMPLSITTDFYGNSRSSIAPNIGAIEVNSKGAPTDIIAPIITYVPFANTPMLKPTFSATITDNLEVTSAKMWYRVRGSTASFTGISGVKQADNKTWTFTILTDLTLNANYEYFICAKDLANNIITNGITTSALDAAAVGLSVNNPAANPSFVRSFKVTDISLTLETFSGAPFYISNTISAAVNIPYTATGIYSPNTFNAYLSTSSGSFAGEILIGSLASEVSGTINAFIPAARTSGSNYLIRIKSTNPVGLISNVSLPFQIINDNSSPVVTLTSSSGSPVYLPFTVTIEFNEIVTGFEQNMITAENAQLSNFSTVVADKKFTVLVTPANSGTVTVKVAADKVKDLADNFNGESNAISLSYIELGVPHLNISAEGDVNYFNDSPVALTFIFDQDVTGFNAADINVSNGSVENFSAISAKVYSAVLIPVSQGKVIISVPDDVALNGTSKGNSSSSLNLIFDDQQPGVSLSRVSGSGVVNAAFGIYIDFNEEITGMTQDMIAVTNGTVSDLIKENGTRYRATVNPSVNNGTVTIGFPADRITDLAGNSNSAASDLNVTVNSVEPVVTVFRTSGSGRVNGSFNVTLSFGTDVTGFVISDISVTNGTASDFTGLTARIYTVNVIPAADGEVKLYVPQGVAQDFASNFNLASNDLKVIADMTDPTVIISRTTGSGAVSGMFNVSVSFSEIVTGFDINDITVSGATLDNLSESGSLYQVDVTPTVPGTIDVSVSGNVSSDLAGNSNSAATPLTVQYLLTDVETIKDNSLNIFPNPTTGVFKIETKNVLSQTIKIFDLNGKLVYTSRIKNSSTEIDLQYLPKGIYMLHLVYENKIVTRKIILY